VFPSDLTSVLHGLTNRRRRMRMPGKGALMKTDGPRCPVRGARRKQTCDFLYPTDFSFFSTFDCFRVSGRFPRGEIPGAPQDNCSAILSTFSAPPPPTRNARGGAKTRRACDRYPACSSRPAHAGQFNGHCASRGMRNRRAQSSATPRSRLSPQTRVSHHFPFPRSASRRASDSGGHSVFMS